MAAKAEIPKYRITAICHHNDRIYDPESTPKDSNGDPTPLYLEFDGHPEYYMEPANAAAEAMVEKFKPRPYVDPIVALTCLKPTVQP